MRIRTTENYSHQYECWLSDCERRYCQVHRLLWRDCETAITGNEGDRGAVNGTRTIVELGYCPECKKEHEHRRMLARLLRDYPEMAICPSCFLMEVNPDDIAIHLMDYHKWVVDKATVWLREQIEEEAFNEQP